MVRGEIGCVNISRLPGDLGFEDVELLSSLEVLKYCGSSSSSSSTSSKAEAAAAAGGRH